MKECVECKGKKFAETTESDTVTVAGQAFSADVPAVRCTKCGAVYVDGPSLGAFELEVARTLADAGVATGETFRYMRRVLGYTAAALGEAIGVAPETISRWERGDRPVDRMAWVGLASMVADRIEGRTVTLDRLRALREPPKLAKTMRLSLPRSAAR